ncbi:MAG: transposase [Gemmatimonadetes bacterium]|nr:transposase [Gemmatimonadota bacterium]
MASAVGRAAEGSEGRRRHRQYPAEFKREQIERILRGEVTAAELSRELGVRRTLIQRWMHLVTKGGETAVRAETKYSVTAICLPRRITTVVNRRFGTAHNTEAPHSSLGMRSPREYRRRLAAAREKQTD